MRIEVRQQLDDAFAEQRPMAFDGFVNLLATVFRDGSIKRDDLPAIKIYADDLFELYVRPYDIPVISGVVEPFVDDAMKHVLGAVIDTLADQLL